MSDSPAESTCPTPTYHCISSFYLNYITVYNYVPVDAVANSQLDSCTVDSCDLMMELYCFIIVT